MSLAVTPYHDEPDADPTCPKCGSDDVEWEDCWACHGDGGFDAHDDDPINFSPGEEFEPCTECGGRGGYMVCHACREAAKNAPMPF